MRMRRIATTLIATAALALPAAATAHDGHGKRHHGWHKGKAALAKLSGTGTTFGGTTATASGTASGGDALGTGTFSASLATTWSSATTNAYSKGSVSCAPATATLSLTGATTSNTLTTTATGKTCAWTKSDGTVIRAFFGRGTGDGAGTLAALDGAKTKVFLVQKADGSVNGAVVSGKHRVLSAQFTLSEKRARDRCDD